MNRILFLHGFASSGNNGTVKALRQLYPDVEIIAPDIPVEPAEALPMLKALAEEKKPDLIIGTSMGAMYTELMHGFWRIAVNPAFQLAETLLKNNGLGRQQFHNPRQDGAKDFLVTKGLLESFREVSSQCFTGIDDTDRERFFGLFGTHDTMVNHYDLCRSHYPNCIHFDGEHYLNEHTLGRAVVPVIQWIDDIQQGRSKPSVFICFDDVLRYSHNGEEVASAPRSILALMKNYDLRFVISADQDGLHTSMDKLDWLETKIAVPAWDRTCLTTRKDMLIGDYLIDAHPGCHHSDDFMGTVIHFGSDNFKNWDEVMTYFERLGGQ